MLIADRRMQWKMEKMQRKKNKCHETSNEQHKKYFNVRWIKIWLCYLSPSCSLVISPTTSTTKQKIITIVEEVVDGKVVSSKETVSQILWAPVGGTLTKIIQANKSLLRCFKIKRCLFCCVFCSNQSVYSCSFSKGHQLLLLYWKVLRVRIKGSVCDISEDTEHWDTVQGYLIQGKTKQAWTKLTSTRKLVQPKTQNR